MRQTAVVFGGTSFIGINLIERLILSGYDVVAVCRPKSPKMKNLYSKFDSQIQYIEVDICSVDTYLHNMDKIEKCDYLYLASWEGTSQRDDATANKRSADGLIQCLQFILEKLQCKRVIQLGTQAEYGRPSRVVTENTICKPITEYGKEKLRFYDTASLICRNKDVPLIEYRIHSVYGRNRGGLLDYVIAKLKTNETCYLNTNCSQMFDYIYIDDCIDALLLGMQELPEGTYNISSGNQFTLKEYLEKIRIIVNPNCSIVYGTQKDDVSPDFFYDSSKIRHITGWRPKYSFENGIKAMIS